MVLIPVYCPHCDSDQVVKCGTTAAGKQRYLCQNDACSHRTFIRDYSYRAYLPEVKRQMIDMAVNGSGIRDTGRVLGVGKDTVLRTLKKKNLTSTRSTKRC
jgi:transposase-like protein